MKTIWKYPLKIEQLNYISVPKGYESLCVQMQDEVPTLWIKVESSNEPEQVVIETYGTGHPIFNDGKYLGTYQVSNLVFHVFEVGND